MYAHFFFLILKFNIRHSDQNLQAAPIPIPQLIPALPKPASVPSLASTVPTVYPNSKSGARVNPFSQFIRYPISPFGVKVVAEIDSVVEEKVGV